MVEGKSTLLSKWEHGYIILLFQQI